MNYTATLNGVTFDIDYSVDSEGDYSEFIIEVSGQCVNEVLDAKVIAELEQVTWDYGYIPDCQSHNDDLRIARYESSLETP
jgi:hypothetical protein